MHCNVFQLYFENVWLKAKLLQEWLFCLMRQNRYCLSNTKISDIGSENRKTSVSAQKN